MATSPWVMADTSQKLTVADIKMPGVWRVQLAKGAPGEEQVVAVFESTDPPETPIAFPQVTVGDRLSVRMIVDDPRQES